MPSRRLRVLVWFLFVVSCLGWAAPHRACAAGTLRMPPPLGANSDLGALWQRPDRSTEVRIEPAPAAKSSQRSTPSVSPFAAKLADRRAAKSHLAPAAFLAQGDALRARLAAYRHASDAARADVARLDAMRAASYLELASRSPDIDVAWDGEQAIFVAGSDLGAGRDPEAAAAAFWGIAAPLFGLQDAASELRLVRRDTDALGQTHLRYQQTFRGHDVWARDAVVHVMPDGRVGAFGGRLESTPEEIGAESASLGAADAEALARRVGATAAAQDLQILVTGAGPRLAWRVRVETGLDRIDDVFVDAGNGTVLHRSSRVAHDGPVTGSGVDLAGQTRSLGLYQVGSTYYNINASKRMWDAAGSNVPQTVKGGIRIFDAQNQAGDPLYFSSSTNPNSWPGRANQVSAAHHASIVYDYFDQRHGRNSINGQGGTMELVTNFKTNYNNAFWNGTFMVFGNGDGNQFSDLAGALDVTGHEMSHGVVENTANLVYENQPGALNESFADVFGTATEFFARPSTANWLLGEEVTTPGIAGDCLRNMQDPGAANVAFGGQQPTRMSEFRNLPNTPEQDNGGVHINSGIPNRAFYLIATSTALGATAAERLDKAERIYYRALSQYLTRSSQFIDCRLAVVRAAGDLFGAGGAVANACAAAFDAVEIFDGTPTEPPPTLPPVQGQDWFAVTDAGTGQLLRVPPDVSQVLPLSTGAILNKPAITDDGAFAFFIGNDRRLRLVRTDGTGEALLSNTPAWWSIAISPDGGRLAATTTDFDGNIYIFDLDNPANDVVHRIYSQNYGGEGDDAAQFADFLDFSNDGQYVLYDAFNMVVQSSGDTLGYWDINVMRAADGNVVRVFPPQPPGVDIGNPTFSPLSDFVIAFDFVDETNNVYVLGADLEEGVVGTVTNNFESLGRPTFAPDATRIAYHYFDTNGASLWRVTLGPDGVSGIGDDTEFATGAFDPVWFAIGSRPAVTLYALTASLDGAAARVAWEASADADHDHFRVLRDAGAGFADVSGPLRDPDSRGPSTSRWSFADDLAGVDSPSLRYAVQGVDRHGEARLLGVVSLDLARAPLRSVRFEPNVPNPFNPSTALRFTLGRGQPVRLEIFDAAGQRVRRLWDGALGAGSHLRTWNGRNDAGEPVASGVYWAFLRAEDGTRTRKLTLLR